MQLLIHFLNTAEPWIFYPNIRWCSKRFTVLWTVIGHNNKVHILETYPFTLSLYREKWHWIRIPLGSINIKLEKSKERKIIIRYWSIFFHVLGLDLYAYNYWIHLFWILDFYTNNKRNITYRWIELPIHFPNDSFILAVADVAQDNNVHMI